MPYNPGNADIGGQLLAQGIQGAAQTYADSQEKMRLTDKEIAHLKGTVDFAAAKNILTPDDLAEFNAGNLSKKREIASRAGMLYQDFQEEQNRKALTLSPEEYAAYGKAGMVPLRTSAKSFQAAAMPEAPFVLSPADAEAIKKSGYMPVQTAKGRYDYLDTTPKAGAMAFDPARDVVPLPGMDAAFVRTSPGGGGNVMPFPRKQGEFNPETAPRVQVGGKEGIVIPDGKGGFRVQFPPGAASGTVQKPMDAAGAMTFGNLTKQIGTIDAEIADHVQNIAAGDKRFGFANFSDRQARLAELQNTKAGLTAQLEAMRPPASAQQVQAPAQRTIRPTVKPSAGKATANTGPALDLSAAGLPEEDGLPQGEGEVLPPLPEEIPTLSPEDAAKLPKGAKFRTQDGRVMTKAN